MHILFINPRLARYHSEPSVWGRRLIEDLRSAKAKVTTLTDYSDNAAPLLPPDGGLGEKIKRAALPALPRALISWLIELKLICWAIAGMVCGSWRALSKRTELRPNVVYARVFEFDWTPWLVATILKCPMVLEVHSLFYLERSFRGRRRSKLIRLIDRRLWQRAASIRVVSKPVADLLSAESIEPERIRFIPYGLDAEPPVDRSVRSPKQSIQIVFVGSFYPWHGVEILLDAFAMTVPRNPDLRLRLIGDGLLRPACERKVRELGISAQVEFTGWLPRDSVVRCFHEADLAVAPFLNIKPFYFDPVKVLDYMAAGLPVIASEIGRITELLEFGRAGVVVPPGDSVRLAEKIVELAADEPKRLQLGNTAREIIEKSYSRQATAKDILALCREAVTKGQPSH
jgi:glycosyltransferase involved in cell wall biosynthesis